MKTMVVKIGSSTIARPGAGVRRPFLADLARQAAELRDMGWGLVVVSSGAIACGAPALGFERRPTDMPSLQACASVGQCELSAAYDEEFRRRGLITSLVLLTRSDTASRSSYLHARDALRRLIELGVVPVVNENDTVAVDEIRFGDNDTLAALVACLVEADLMVILSDIEGLFDANPHFNPEAKLIGCVEAIGPEIMAVAGGVGTTVGSGGMITKIKAARVLMVAGIPLVVCDGHRAEAIVDAAAGEDVGTLFVAAKKPHEITPKKLWIALGDAARGALAVDDGAKAALIERGSSLLSVGVRSVEGRFEANDIVDIKDATGHLFARGKVAFASDEAALAIGRTRAELQANRLLASLADKPLVHRDELVVFE